MRRRSTGKRLRFEVLKRDGFKCRYYINRLADCGTSRAQFSLFFERYQHTSDLQTAISSLAASCIQAPEPEASP